MPMNLRIIHTLFIGISFFKITVGSGQVVKVEELRETAFHNYFFLGTVKLLYENHKKAIQYYDSLLAKPEVLDSLGDKKNEALCLTKYRLAECHRWVGNYNLALEYFQESTRCDYDLYSGYIGLSDIYMKFDELDSAKKYLTLALKLDSTQADVHYGLGKINFEQGNYIKAILAFTKCIENGCCFKPFDMDGNSLSLPVIAAF